MDIKQRAVCIALLHVYIKEYTIHNMYVYKLKCMQIPSADHWNFRRF